MSNPIPAAGQIWFVDQPRLPGADDPHYALVTYVASDWSIVHFNFITTEGDVTNRGDFKIDSADIQFPQTGLKHSSHLRIDHYYDVDMETFVKNKHRGFVCGDLKRRIEEWFGSAF